MSFTLDPEVAEVFAPFAAQRSSPPVGDVAARRAALEPVFRYGDTARLRWYARTYALRLGQAGVPVEFHLHPGVPHEFDFIAFDTAAARRAVADRVRVLASL